MSKEMDDLAVEVQHTATVSDSAVTLIQGLADQISSLKNDPVALEQMATDLRTKADALSAAITANTPVAPPPPPPVDTTGGGAGNDTVSG